MDTVKMQYKNTDTVKLPALDPPELSPKYGILKVQ